MNEVIYEVILYGAHERFTWGFNDVNSALDYAEGLRDGGRYKVRVEVERYEAKKAGE